MANPQPRYFAPTGDSAIDGLTNGYFWLLDSSKTIDYSISNGFHGEYWTVPSSTLATYMGTALSWVSNYANIKFNYVFKKNLNFFKFE